LWCHVCQQFKRVELQPVKGESETYVCNCPECGTMLTTIKVQGKVSKPVFVIVEDDVWEMANRLNIEIPEEEKQHVLHVVKKYIDGYCFDSPYNIWNAIKDGIKDALGNP